MLTRRTRLTGDQGSSLLLLPTGVLVMLILGAIGADLSRVDSARASLYDLAATIASDVSTGAMNRDAYRSTSINPTATPQRYQLNDATAKRIIDVLIAHRSDSGLQITGYEPVNLVYQDDGRAHVKVVIHGHVPYFFAKVVPGAGSGMDITATSEVALEDT